MLASGDGGCATAKEDEEDDYIVLDRFPKILWSIVYMSQ